MSEVKKVGRETGINDITVQAFNFSLDGFETTSVAMFFAAHAIATNLDVQVKLRQEEEIDKIMEKSNGKVTYEIINQFEYLDTVINETFRFLGKIIRKRLRVAPH